MTTWDANQYLKFADERARPAADLIAHIAPEPPRRIVDLGCGPGNSTEQLHGRWPQAEITGLDSSAEMLAKARKSHPDWRWVQSDIAGWKAEAPFDLVFANASLHWIAGHEALFPHLLRQVAPGGALAAQMPAQEDSPTHRLLKEVGAEFAESLRGFRYPMWIGEPDFYYDALAAHAARVEVWKTVYHHPLSGPEKVVEWIRGSTMRPFLEALPDEATSRRFEQRCLERFAEAFPRRKDGKILLPYPRVFVVAYA